MLRRVASKVAWVGRTASMVFGLALVLALMLGVATMALAGTGVGDTFNLGRLNTVNRLSQLVGSTDNPMLRIDNNGGAANATALELQVEPGQPPMTVNSRTKVANLNADKIDDIDSSQIALDGEFDIEQVIDHRGPLPLERTYTAKGGSLLVLAGGSGYRSTSNTRGPGNIGMYVEVDSGFGAFALAQPQVFTNERQSHKAFVADTGIFGSTSPGQTITFRLKNAYSSECNTASETADTYCTTTNADDRFFVTVVELPNFSNF
jgi:hypothetical protein